MVLRDKIKNNARTFVFVLLTLLFSCEEMNIVIVNCDECFPDDPTTVSILIKLDSKFGETEVKIYEGNLEDDIVYDSFTVMGEERSISLPVNRTYTITATYNSNNGNKYVAVDAVSPRVKYDKNSCEEPCYYTYNNTANLRLKYTK